MDESSIYYQELTCLSDHDISVGFLIGKVMDVVHLALVNASINLPQCPIGISFPEYRDLTQAGLQSQNVDDDGTDLVSIPSVPIGSKIRLFARDESILERVDLSVQLNRFSDYVHLTSVRLLQRKISRYAVYTRSQPKYYKDRLIRRQMRRQGMTLDQATEIYRDFQPRHSRLPFVNMKSHSTGERFRLYVERSDTDTLGQWGFSTYGLSAKSAVPEF